MYISKRKELHSPLEDHFKQIKHKSLTNLPNNKMCCVLEREPQRDTIMCATNNTRLHKIALYLESPANLITNIKERTSFLRALSSYLIYVT